MKLESKLSVIEVVVGLIIDPVLCGSWVTSARYPASVHFDKVANKSRGEVIN